MRKNGQSVAAIVQSLITNGPQTSYELAQSTGIHAENLRSVIARMLRPSARTPKRIYVLRYIDYVEGTRTYTRAEYALGDGPNAKKQLKSGAEIKREYRGRHKRRLRMSRYPEIVQASGMWAGLL